MVDCRTIELVSALGEVSTRSKVADALASELRADALRIFVEDPDVGAFIPAPGGAPSVVGGPAWRALLERCRVAGVHTGTVAHPTADIIVPAIACAGSGVALVFVGGRCDPELVAPITLLLPLLGSAVRAQHGLVAAAGAVAVARQDARHAGTLAQALDAARADLARQAKSLEDARGRAERAMRAKDEFLAMLGHELRNPLAPIVTALHLMRLKGKNSREQEIVERQVAQLMRLIDDLLDVARIASGKVELRKDLVELGSVAMRAIEIASPLLEEKRQALTVDVPSHGLLVKGDSDRLAQVFSNLLTNAAKYSDPNTRILFAAKRGEDAVRLSVKDEGIGIEPSMLEAIFEQFVQQRQSIDRSQGGLGLGLAIVRSLVARHGGTVRALSEGRGKGSEFVVELPLAKAGEIPADGATRDEEQKAVLRLSATATERVLVVDDNRDAAEMLGEALSELGYHVRVALDGPSALRLIDDFRPRIALLDIGLPVMDGYELARRLREAPLGCSMHLVALTGYGQATDKASSRAAGFDAHLVKPVDFAELQSILADFCSRQAHS